MAEKRDKAVISFAQFMTIIALVMAIYFIVDLSHRALVGYRIQQEERRLDRGIEAEEAENRRLRERLTYVQTDEYVEEEARGWKWGREGEVLVVVPTPQRPLSIPEPVPSAESRPLWRGWWDSLSDWLDSFLP